MTACVEKKQQVVHALSRRRRPGACAVQAFCRRQDLAAGRIDSARGLEELGPQTNAVCLGVDDLKPFDAVEFAEALI